MTSASEILAQSRLGRRTSRARRGPTPEGAILQTIKHGLRARGVPFWRIGVGGVTMGERFVKLGDAGLPDLVALVPGRGAVFLEVKAPSGRLSREQVAFRDACRRAGANHVVARSWEDVEPWLAASGGAPCR